MAEQLKNTSYLFGANSIFIEELYNRYIEDPSSVDVSWKNFFKTFGDEVQSVAKGTSWAPKEARIVGYKDVDATKTKRKLVNDSIDVSSACTDSIKALMLIRGFKVRGHLLADLDPLDIDKKVYHPDLDPATYGFGEEKDYEREIYLGGALGYDYATLSEILRTLRKTYCRHVGIEFMHMESLEQRDWVADKIEYLQLEDVITKEEKIDILQDILELETFEQFLHTKFPGAKRFSIEGGETAIAAAEVVIDVAAELGVTQIVIGMPHRGRLNVLTKVLGKRYAAMLSEFQGNLAHPGEINISGDVKYHLGASSDREFDGGKKVHLSLTANPSHLEAVNPVVVGKVRAKQNQMQDEEERSKAMGILFHGDAAFAGQGVVAETLGLSDLHGYETGGTIHIIVNNQIGFTTDPRNARSSPYPSDVAKIVQAPIFHVNGDDPEAVSKVSRIAVEFRKKFKKDVVIDVFCYRRYGHNEGDEPFFTQPVMYSKIRQHKTPMHVYAEKLVEQGVITEDEFQGMVKKFKSLLEKEHRASLTYKPEEADFLEGQWAGLERPEDIVKPVADTAVPLKKLKAVGGALSNKDVPIKTHSKIARQLDAKRKMIDTGKGIDWATAEALAFGSLLTEGVGVRLSGQDCERGTFSQRHSVLNDQDTNKKYYPLNNIESNQARYEVINSNLSEFAVLGFEYGYSLAEPNNLTLWEAQFGDFVNGAQVIIDQFITSGENKWLRMSGLVMLLPHGFEGQGPEHSSARLERYLQACAEDNIQVANCTTPANYFHILRRQICRNFRKPLILMTPKSLLRHKLAVSDLKDMAEGSTFKRVIEETDKLTANTKVKRVVICSGKVYYELYEERQKQKIDDVAIIRLEQFYPFPAQDLQTELKKYKNANVVWCQEEPKNMGGWFFVDRRIEEVMTEVKGKFSRPIYAGRKAAASPAAGYMKIHKEEQNALINDALGIK